MHNEKESTPESCFSKRVEKDGITTEIKVKEAENGFIITVCESGYKKKDTSNYNVEDADPITEPEKEYYYIENKYISKVNPLEAKPVSIKEQINAAIKTIK